MTRSHSRKEKSGRRKVSRDDDLLEGTSARTRPFSYDDIMLRRNNKSDVAKQVPSGSEVADIALGHDNVEKKSDFPESRRKINEVSVPLVVKLTSNHSEKVSSRRKGDSDIALGHDNVEKTSDFPESLRKTNEVSVSMDAKHTSNDSQKVSSRRKRESEIALGHANIEKTSDFPESCRKINEVSEPMDAKHTSNDSQKVSSRRKRDSDIALGHGIIEKTSDFPESCQKINEVSEPMDVKLTSNDSQKVSSRRKRDSDIALGHDIIEKRSDFPESCRKINEVSEPMDVKHTSNDSPKVSSQRKRDSDIALGHDIMEKPSDFPESCPKKNEVSEPMDVKHTSKDSQKVSSRRKGESDIALGHDNIEKTSDFPESCRKINEDYEPGVVKHTLDDSQKVRKGDSENVPKKNDKFVQDKDERSRYRDVKLKSIWEKNEGNKRVREGENERRDHSNRNKDVFLGVGSDSRSNKRQARDPYRKDRISERVGIKSETDRKQLLNDERQVDRKRRNERDLMQIERLTDRGREKSEKENRHRRHDEEDKTKIRNTDKKDDSGRKGPDPTRVSLEGSKAKRIRSRSRERDNRDRGRRSRSHSPKVHKRDHGELSSHSTKDRPGREHSDVDKKRVSTNGSNSYNRRNVGPTSGLGGYSPRKRKTESAAKTPSPTRRSPEKKTAGWDLKPVEKDSVSSTLLNLQPPSQILAMNVKKFLSPVPPTVVKPIVVSHHTVSSQMHAIESVQLTQATRPMRRLYVENLPPSASEKDLIDCINKSFLSYGVNYIRGTQPCISCIIHKEKSQALLEFLTPEDASSALSLDGMPFSGSKLKLRRPKDFSSVTTGLSDKSAVAADSMSDIVEDSPNKIFLGGISKLISSNMLLEIARAFGPVKAFCVEFISDLNEPCAFLEYVDHSVTPKACAGLNGMNLGGRIVTAVCATPEAIMDNVGKLPFNGVPEHAKPLLDTPTAVLKLNNVFDPECFLSLSDSELEEMLGDIKLECSRFGSVKSINVAKLTNSVGTVEAYEEKNASVPTDVYDSELVNRSHSQIVNLVGELDRSEPTETLNVSENNNQTVEDSKGSDNIDNPIAVNLVKDDKISVIAANKQNASVVESESDDKTAGYISETKVGMENESLIERDLQSEEHNAKSEICGEELILEETNAPAEGGEKEILMNLENADMENKPLVEEYIQCEEPDAKIENFGVELKLAEITEEGDKKDIICVDLENFFEPGSVFVEYRRSEAACVAAHCLHGRVFDGRVVTVGYVGLDLYQMRFRK